MWCIAHNWCFVIRVSVDAQGSIDTYQSKNYKSYDKCYEDYFDFSPEKQWSDLKNILDEYIIGTYEYINILDEYLVDIKKFKIRAH